MDKFADLDLINPEKKLSRETLTVTQLIDLAGVVLDEYMGSIAFSGEIHEVKIAGSGHLYLTIKDETPGAQAAVSCVMWRSAVGKLGFQPIQGLSVSCVGKPTLYRARGQFQIDIRTMSPAGDGVLRKKFEDLRLKLEKEGLFDPQRKRAIPKMSRCVGVVTSAVGAVLHDISATIGRRMPSIKIICADVRVQGRGASEEIVKGIELLNGIDEIDVIIVARGGGSLEDLWAFNEESVVRAIFGSRKVVISAVGHEVDVTLSDFAADLRAPTPTAAAEIVAPDVRELSLALNSLESRLQRAERWLRDRERFLDLAEDSLDGGLNAIFRRLQGRMETTNLLLQSISPERRISGVRDNVERTFSRATRAILMKIALEERRIDQAQAVLSALNPQRVLERGYALVFQDGHVVDSVTKVPSSGDLVVRFHDGERNFSLPN